MSLGSSKEDRQFTDSNQHSQQFIQNWRSDQSDLSSFTIESSSLDSGADTNSDQIDLAGATQFHKNGPAINFAPSLSTSVTAYSGSRAFYQSLFREVSQAEKSVDFFLFTLGGDIGHEFVDVLGSLTARGVTVRAGLDSFGIRAKKSAGQAMLEHLKQARVQVHLNRPVFGGSPLIGRHDHRKLWIIDDLVAHIGSANVAPHFLEWVHDVGVRLEGPIVSCLKQEWLSNWLFRTGQQQENPFDFAKGQNTSSVVGGIPTEIIRTIPAEHFGIKKFYGGVISQAKKSIFIENCYLTDREIVHHLDNACSRGVEVCLLVPERSESSVIQYLVAGHLYTLSRAGAEIWLHPDVTHGKIIIVDGEITSVGSGNFDTLSLERNYDLNVAFYSKALAERMLEDVLYPEIKRSQAFTPASTARLRRLVRRGAGSTLGSIT